MKAKISILAIILALVMSNGFAQEKSKKQLKEEKKIEKQKLIDSLVNAKTFDFVGRTAMPSGYKSVNLSSTTNYVKFQPELIDSYMPFYGRAYSGVGYGTDEGLKFTGKPEDFTVTKGKKNYSVNATVKGDKDTFRLSLTVGFEGSASLSITSNNRSVISYSGDISAPEKKEEKKQ
jgi:spore coat protein CotH